MKADAPETRPVSPNPVHPNPTFGLTVPGELVDALADAVADRLRDAAAPSAETPQGGCSRLALSIAEAAEALGMSPDHFRRHVLPGLRIVRSGRLRLVPLVELDAWITANAARALETVA